MGWFLVPWQRALRRTHFSVPTRRNLYYELKAADPRAFAHYLRFENAQFDDLAAELEPHEGELTQRHNWSSHFAPPRPACGARLDPSRPRRAGA